MGCFVDANHDFQTIRETASMTVSDTALNPGQTKLAIRI